MVCDGRETVFVGYFYTDVIYLHHCLVWLGNIIMSMLIKRSSIFYLYKLIVQSLPETSELDLVAPLVLCFFVL